MSFNNTKRSAWPARNHNTIKGGICGQAHRLAIKVFQHSVPTPILATTVPMMLSVFTTSPVRLDLTKFHMVRDEGKDYNI